MSKANVTVTLVLDDDATNVALPASAMPREGIGRVRYLLDRALVTGGKVIATVGEGAGSRASLSWTMAQADCTAGDKLIIGIPGRGAFVLTAVSGTPDVTAGEYAIITSDTATAASVAAAINGNLGLKDLVSATSSTATVTVTAKHYGTIGNSYVVRESVTTSTASSLAATDTAFSGGLSTCGCAAAVVTITHANVSAGDTVKVGTVTLTWAVLAANENEVTIGGSASADATALAAAVNAHSVLSRLVSASAASAVVTITALRPGIAGNFYVNTSDAAACTITGAVTTSHALAVAASDAEVLADTARVWKLGVD